MAAPLSKNWRKFPPLATQIDWSNPLTRNLGRVITPSYGLIDVVTRKIATVQGTVLRNPAGFKASTLTGDRIELLDFPSSQYTCLAIANAYTAVGTKVLISRSSATPSFDQNYVLYFTDGITPVIQHKQTADNVYKGTSSSFNVSPNSPAVVVGLYDGTNQKIFVNGRLGNSAAATAPYVTFSGAATQLLTVNAASANFGYEGLGILLAAIWNRALTDAEVAEVSENPWQLFRSQSAPVVFFAPPAAEITGTLNVTEADDTLASTGALAIAGSLSVTEASDSLSSTGILPLAGFLTVTEEGDALASTGTVSLSGSLNVTEEGDALASTGALSISGSLSVTEDSDTLASSGTSGATGSLNVTEEGDTLTATATVTQLVGGGGMGKQKRQRGWANERARLEASLQTETAAQEVKTATKILRASDSESARRVAELVREYESARATLEQLRTEVERLRVETEASERLRDEVETAAKVVEIFAQEEAELLEILDIIDEMESRALLIALGIAA